MIPRHAGQISSASYAIRSTEAATTLYRVDREAMTCTLVVLTPRVRVRLPSIWPNSISR
jgi:hypothetical protein